MRVLLKGLTLVVLAAIVLGGLDLWYSTYVIGKYYMAAGIFRNIIVGSSPLFLVGFAAWAAKEIVKYKGNLFGGGSGTSLLLLGFLALDQAGCAKANANVQTLVTSNCGVSWQLIKPGETIPASIGYCSYRVTIPDYPMQGDTKFKTSFKDRVLAEVEVAYEYIIIDGAIFIGEAKYLGKKDSDADDTANSSKQYESAENAVIDKRIRDAATEMLLKEDIVEFSQAEFEDKLLTAVNAKLKDKGVRLNFISFVPIPEAQTRLAIDMMTAMKIYRSRGLDDLGKAVAAARAGATQIQVTACSGSDKVKD